MIPFDSRVRAVTEVRPETGSGSNEPDVVRGGDRPGWRPPALQAAHPVGKAQLSARRRGTSALGQQTQRGRLHLPASDPLPHQSMASTSPGDQTAGRRPPARPCPARHCRFTSATSRRKLRSDPSYPAARTAGSNRFALIRPRSTLPSRRPTRRPGQSCGPGSIRAGESHHHWRPHGPR